MAGHTLVLGLGNTLLTDEGCGVHAVRYLQAHYPGLPDTVYLDGGTLSFTLAGDIHDAARLIVIDAAQLGAPPGSVRCFTGAEMDRFLGGVKRSVHEVGLLDLLDIARLGGHLPAQRALVGIQPHSLEWGEQPSPAVAPAIAEAAEEVVKLARAWRNEKM